MKTFWAACILLILLVTFSLGSSLRLARIADDLADEARALSSLPRDARAAAVADFDAAWSARRFAFSLGIHHAEFDRLEDALTATRAAAETENDGEFWLAAASLADAVAHIRDLLGVSWDNLL